MTSIQAIAPRRVLADALPGGAARDAALVAGSAGFVGLAAQVSVPLPFTPVPLTLQTFAVLLAAAAVGPLRGLLGMVLYTALGVAGLPWFSGHSAGWATASFGYILGFVLAAVVTGELARRGGDRTPARTVGLMLLGSLVILAVGVPWLMAAAHLDLGRALLLGVVPFLPGDAVKIALAAALLPAAWRLSRRSTPDA